MRIAADLHIHSALSPCGDKDMTPNNIVNMAYIKGLDVIAVTDHNSAENVGAVMKLGAEKGIIVVPGMEVQSKEEVHLLCYFPGLEQALDFQKLIYDNLEGENRPDFFGEQLVMDGEDRIIARNSRLLIGSTLLSVEQISRQVVDREGKLVPAHIDRKAYSIISNLGFIPPDLGIGTVELGRGRDAEGLLRQFPYLEQYRVIHSSDAHKLEDISEREFFMDVNQKEVIGIINVL